MLKLDLGAGERSPDGFTPLGNINGTQIYPLPYADGSVDEIRASHVLEHFPHREVGAVVADWVRALKPGGMLKIAVPDFGKIAEQYVAGVEQNTMGYVMGGQTDGADFHKTIFDIDSLAGLLAQSGLMLIRQWQSELPDDCAALPISLNLAGTKPHVSKVKMSAVMSVPRLGFMDNMFAAIEAFAPLGIKVRRHTGAFWEQCIERVIEDTIREDKPDAILTLDYDTVFTRADVEMLQQLLCCYPEADAIAPLQAGRGGMDSLFTMRGNHKDGDVLQVPVETFMTDLAQVATAHFGLTVLRTAKFAGLAKPLFHSQPSPAGDWNAGRTDADIYFWRQWGKAGNTLFLANRVTVGHLELSVLWPGQDLKTITQSVKAYRDSGKPQGVWQ